MASKDGSRARGRGKRLIRSGRVSASDEDDYNEPTPTVKRTSRRTSIIRVEPKGDPDNGVENRSVHEAQQEQGAGEDHSRRPEPAATTERVRATAGRVGGQIQDTVSSAMDKTGLPWHTLGTLLLLAVLTSWLTSRLAQPSFTDHKVSALRTTMEKADQRYSSLLKKLQDAEERLEFMEEKMRQIDNIFQQNGDDSMTLSRKAEPNTIINVAEQRMQSLLEKYAADKTGLVDYALAPAGGKVIGHSQLYPRPDDPALTTWSQIGAKLIPGAMPAVHPRADKFVLTPGGPVPGECLPLNGTKGEIILRLREPIIPTTVTYEHVPSAITYDFRSAPMDITVVGWLSEAYRFARKGGWIPVLEHRKPIPPKQIGSFTYDFSRSNLQTVAVDSDIVVDHVRFQVHSNYGKSDYTCIYRVRVHGIAAAGHDEGNSAGEVASDAESLAGSVTSSSF